MRAGRVARFGLGAVLFLVSLAEARRSELPGYEERLFRRVNGASDLFNGSGKCSRRTARNSQIGIATLT